MFKMKEQSWCSILGFQILQVLCSLFYFAGSVFKKKKSLLTLQPPPHTHTQFLFIYVYLMYIFILFV